MLRKICSAMVIVGLWGHLTYSQDGFFDDFTGGGSSVTWSPLGSSDISVEAEDLLVSGNVRLVGNSFSGARVLEPYRDVSLRTQARLTQGEWIAVTVRDDTQPIYTQYVGALSEDGSTTAGRLSSGNVFSAGENIQTNLDPKNEDVMLQIDAIGDEISFWAWRPEETMPSEPLFSFEDSRIEEGFVTVNFGSQRNETVSGVLRFVQVDTQSIPEPCTAMLAALGLVGVLILVRRSGSR